VASLHVVPPTPKTDIRQDAGNLLKLSLSDQGLAIINRFLSDVVAESVHLIGVVDRSGLPRPLYLTPGDSSQCSPPTNDGSLHQATGVDCWWSNDFSGFALVGGKNLVAGKSQTYCTGDCSNLTGFVNGMVGTRNKGMSNQKVMESHSGMTVSSPALLYWDTSQNPPQWNGGAWDGWISTDIQPGVYTQESFHGYTTTGTDAEGKPETIQLAPPFNWVNCASPIVCTASSGYGALASPLWGQITIGVPTSTPSQATAMDYYVLAGCPPSSPVGLYAFISFPNPPANLVGWTGGNAGSDNFHRSVPCTNPGDVPVSFSLNGYQMASATIHVITPVTIEIVPGSVMVGHSVQAVATSPETASVQLSWSGPTPVTINQPSLSLTAGIPQTVTIMAGTQPSQTQNDVEIIASINGSQVGQGTLTVVPQLATTVFLLHGIGQGSSDMAAFQSSLTQRLAADGFDSTEIVVDASFNFGCATNWTCDSSCGISAGAAVLDQTVWEKAGPGSDVMLVGYSMGGLVARDMMANARFQYPDMLQRNITALVTLGTPNLGYPWASVDDAAASSPFVPIDTCPFQMDQMGSDFRAGETSAPPTFNPHVSPTPGSDYLRGLTSAWSTATQVPSWGPVYWLAISGSYCSGPIRVLATNSGCPDYNPWSDGIVCDQSARYQLPDPENGWPSIPAAVDVATRALPGNAPTNSYAADYFAHTTTAIMCAGFTSPNPVLFNPSLYSDVMNEVVAAIESHQ
jgi:pimeloyl-ACP methyl ester carboxylesterase